MRSAQLVASNVPRTPALIAVAGERTAYRFLEFFTTQIRNSNTRRAYVRAVGSFLTWLEVKGVASITAVSSLHVAAYVEQLTRSEQSAPTVKQQLAAIRRLFDWLAAGGVLPFNPASAVRGPSHSAKTGATPVLDPQRRGSSSTRSTSPRQSGVVSTEMVEFSQSRAVGGAPHMAEPAALLNDHRAPLVGSGC